MLRWLRLFLMGGAMCGGLAGSALAQIAGTVTHITFTGPVTGAEVRFNIYLPPGYHGGVARYPVLYHLHGIGGNENGQHTKLMPELFEEGVALGLVRPVILVFPNGFDDSFWADGIGGDQPAESTVIQDLIPYVDAQYRTIARPEFRGVMGYSMGGFGAVKFFGKFPELFACCVSFDGAIMYWEQLLQRHPATAESVFGSSSAYFDVYSPWTWPIANAEVIGASTRIRMPEGLLVDYGRLYRDHLNAAGIAVDYVETGCPHNLGCILDAEGLASVAFIESNLGDPCPGDVDGDGATDLADFVGLAQSFGSTVSPGTAGDLNGDGVVNSDDFTIFATGFGCRL